MGQRPWFVAPKIPAHVGPAKAHEQPYGIPVRALMMSVMRHIDVRDDLRDGFEPAERPEQEPVRQLRPPRPRLCEAGPCANYHRMEIQIEAERPRGRKLPIFLPVGTPGATKLADGTLYQAPAPFHTEVHHYCYPTWGVETNLGSLPVTKCNRWTPHSGRGPMTHEEFWDSPPGQKFKAELAAWERHHAEEMALAEATEKYIADALAVAAPSASQGDTP